MWSHQEDDIKALEAVLNEGFHKEEGPFVKALDRALASFNVQRQAYYSGTFVGNHVHRTLKTNIYNNVAVQHRHLAVFTKLSDL